MFTYTLCIVGIYTANHPNANNVLGKCKRNCTSLVSISSHDCTYVHIIQHAWTCLLTGQTLPVNVMGLGTPLAMLVEPKVKSSSPTSPVVYLPSGQLPALSS